MKISLKVNKLFGIFNYNLIFDKQVSILTSPNGFGKTTILKMLHFVYIKNFNKLIEIDFASFEIKINNDCFCISKNKVILTINYNGTSVLDFNVQTFIHDATKLSYIKNPQTGKWTHSNLLHLGTQAPTIPENQIISQIYFTNQDLSKLWQKLPKTLLIRADRLIDYYEDNIQQAYYNQYNQQNINLTVNKYSHDLRNLMNITFNNYFNESQSLDSRFMTEIINFNGKALSQQEYEDSIKKIEDKNALISKYGISQAIPEATPQYDKNNKTIFTIYIKHRIKKLSKFNDLLDRCELFTKVINEKRFINKNIVVNMQNGITAQQNGNTLDLQYLSNGEQNQLILLYELLFRAQNIDFILIDEPEVGLHVSWQLEFIDDLKKILEISGNMSSIIVTHSPQIINDEWENVIDLSKNNVPSI